MSVYLLSWSHSTKDFVRTNKPPARHGSTYEMTISAPDPKTARQLAQSHSLTIGDESIKLFDDFWLNPQHSTIFEIRKELIPYIVSRTMYGGRGMTNFQPLNNPEDVQEPPTGASTVVLSSVV